MKSKCMNNQLCPNNVCKNKIYKILDMCTHDCKE